MRGLGLGVNALLLWEDPIGGLIRLTPIPVGHLHFHIFTTSSHSTTVHSTPLPNMLRDLKYYYYYYYISSRVDHQSPQQQVSWRKDTRISTPNNGIFILFPFIHILTSTLVPKFIYQSMVSFPSCLIVISK